MRAELSDHDQAARSLERALTVAERDGYRRPFIDQGEPMQALLARQSRTDAAWQGSMNDRLSVVGDRLAVACAAHGREP